MLRFMVELAVFPSSVATGGGNRVCSFGGFDIVRLVVSTGLGAGRNVRICDICINLCQQHLHLRFGRIS